MTILHVFCRAIDIKDENDINPIPYGVFEGFFDLTHAYEHDTLKYATWTFHKRFWRG